MNITVNSQLLAQELRALNKVVSAKPTLPHLGSILFKADNPVSLLMAATDLEVSLWASCVATIHDTGVMTLPAKKLLDLVEQLPDGDVNIELQHNQARISSGNFRSRLQSFSADDFPRVPFPSGSYVMLPAAGLRRLIDCTSFAISDKSQKYVLDGALLSLVDSLMAMVATDGKRLSIATSSRPAGANASVILPSKTLEILEGDDDFEFYQTDKNLFFSSGPRVLVSRMLEGTFPQYERIIPKDCDKFIVVNRLALAAALRRVGVVAEESQAIYLTFERGSVVLVSSSATIGDAQEQVSASYDGPKLRICVNGKFVLDFLEHAQQPTIQIAAKDENNPLLLTDGSDFINVVMLMRG